MAAACVAALAGCMAETGATAADVDRPMWRRPAELVVTNSDTVGLRDMGLYLRYNNRFSEDTLTVRVSVVSPDSLRVQEYVTVAVGHEAVPAALRGNADVVYRRRAVLRHAGDYLFTITPTRPVRGIEAVGINIEKSK